MRARVIIALLAIALPAVVLTLLFSWRAHREAFVETLYEATVDRMEDGGRARCEADPDRFALGVGRGPRGRRARAQGVWTFDRDLSPTTTNGSPMDEPLRDALEAGENVAMTSARGRTTLAMRMPWTEGPCAVLVVERRGAPPGMMRALGGRGVLGELGMALGLLGIALAVVFVALASPLRRLAALSAAARGSNGALEVPESTMGKDEIGEVARALADASARIREHVARLEARDRALTDYVDGTTHDLAIPLTVLLGRLSDAETAAREGRAIDPSLLASALGEGQYLAQLVANLGAASRLDRDPVVERRPIDLGAIVERVVERHRPVARHRGITLDFSVPDRAVMTLGDDILIERAVGNLVHNAIRHHRGQGGHVAVLLEREGARFSLRVLDDGEGVDDALVQRLSRGDVPADQRGSRGSGLGVRIVRRIAEAHGFEVEFARGDEGGLVARIRGEATG